MTVWGEAGVSRMPVRVDGGTVAALASRDHCDCARTGSPHPADLRLGVDVVELLEEVEAQLARWIAGRVRGGIGF